MKRPRQRCSMPPLTRASTSSIRRTDTVGRRARRTWAARSPAAATISCSRRSSRQRSAKSGREGRIRTIFGWPWRIVCADCGRTASTCIGSTSPIPKVPISDTLAALDGLVKAGKVREDRLLQLHGRDAARGRCRRDGREVRQRAKSLSLLHREDETNALPECERLGMAYLSLFPLANGLLTGKYRKGQQAHRRRPYLLQQQLRRLAQ